MYFVFLLPGELRRYPPVDVRQNCIVVNHDVLRCQRAYSVVWIDAISVVPDLPKASMASLSNYAKKLFASSYGENKPEFFVWHPKGLPASEKKLLFKIDLFILTYACLAYFTKWLDQANLSNAYVSGMKEDLKMYGTEYNLASTCFSVGQILGPIPANILLTWVPPRFLLPGLELIWAVLTIGTYAVRDVNQVRTFHAARL